LFSCLSTYQIQQLTAEIKTQQTCRLDETCQLCSSELLFFLLLFLRNANYYVFDFQTEPKPTKTGGTGPKKFQKFEVVIPKYFSESKINCYFAKKLIIFVTKYII